MRNISDTKKLQIKDMLDDGCSNSEISRTLDVDYRSIKRYFPDSGWTPQQSIEYSHMRRAENRAHYGL